MQGAIQHYILRLPYRHDGWQDDCCRRSVEYLALAAVGGGWVSDVLDAATLLQERKLQAAAPADQSTTANSDSEKRCIAVLHTGGLHKSCSPTMCPILPINSCVLKKADADPHSQRPGKVLFIQLWDNSLQAFHARDREQIWDLACRRGGGGNLEKQLPQIVLTACPRDVADSDAYSLDRSALEGLGFRVLEGGADFAFSPRLPLSSAACGWDFTPPWPCLLPPFSRTCIGNVSA